MFNSNEYKVDDSSTAVEVQKHLIYSVMVE